jgi:protein SCO1
MKAKIFLGISLFVLLIIGGTQWLAPSGSYIFHGARIEPAPRAADFTLIAQDGKPYRLSDQAGKIVLIYFGYTTCPDVCPATLSQLRQVRALLKQQANLVQVVFITIDPERDPPERLRSYLGNFDPTFVGLSGPTSDLDPVWRAYGVYRAKVTTGNSLSYTMDHGSYIYVIDSRGLLRETFSFGETTANILEDVKFLLGSAAN